MLLDATLCFLIRRIQEGVQVRETGEHSRCSFTMHFNLISYHQCPVLIYWDFHSHYQSHVFLYGHFSV